MVTPCEKSLVAFPTQRQLDIDMSFNFCSPVFHLADLGKPKLGSGPAPGMADHLVLQPEQLLAVRRHTDHIFGRGLREEIFVPL